MKFAWSIKVASYFSLLSHLSTFLPLFSCSNILNAAFYLVNLFVSITRVHEPQNDASCVSKRLLTLNLPLTYPKENSLKWCFHQNPLNKNPQGITILILSFPTNVPKMGDTWTDFDLSSQSSVVKGPSGCQATTCDQPYQFSKKTRNTCGSTISAP